MVSFRRRQHIPERVLHGPEQWRRFIRNGDSDNQRALWSCGSYVAATAKWHGSGNDDDSSQQVVAFGFEINFYGKLYSTAYINNNGNITFDSSFGTYTPGTSMQNLSIPMIAPFWADVDTRGGLGSVTYDPTTFNSHSAFRITWNNVGYFSEHGDLRNTFSLYIVNRPDVNQGDFDIVFDYGQLQWETGDASGGSDGFGGTPARAGYSNGSGQSGMYFELSGSGIEPWPGRHDWAADVSNSKSAREQCDA